MVDRKTMPPFRRRIGTPRLGGRLPFPR